MICAAVAVFVAADVYLRTQLQKHSCYILTNRANGVGILEGSPIRCNNAAVSCSWPEVIWLVGCFELIGPLRRYFGLYWAVSRREGERGEKIEESKKVQTTRTRTYYKCNRPLPYYHPTCRTPRHWKFTQDHRMPTTLA